MKALENKDICTKCGGKCCKHCGCLWFPSDFKEISFSSIEKILEDGSSSIVGTPIVVQDRTRLKTTGVTLSLRARNVGKGAIDLISLPSSCGSLTENGCKFDFKNRPSGGKHLIPTKDMKSCYEDFNVLAIERKWYTYNKILSRLVKRYTGNSVMDEYRKQVLSYLCSWCSLSEGEILRNGYEEMQEVTNLLITLFPNEANEVIKSFNLSENGNSRTLKR